MKASPFTAIFSMALYSAYFFYRIRYAQDASLSSKDNLLAFAWIITELGLTIRPYIDRIMHCFAKSPVKFQPLRAQGDDIPQIDVFITCCGEDLDILTDTIKAACHQDYPKSQFRVFVLDDDASIPLQGRVKSLKCGYTNLYYMTREKSRIPDYKAGNLNNGFHFSKGFGKPGDFVAGIDADVIVEPCWLRAMIPHLLQDPNLAMIGPPQAYYNVLEQDFLCEKAFPCSILKMRGATGVSWCQGSGYVARREAIESIGGWPTSSPSEDVLASMKLLGSGWRTAYAYEPLQHGLVPNTFMAHVKQCQRWNIGGIQNGLTMRFCLFGPLVPN